MATVVEDVRPHTHAHHEHIERVVERDRPDNGLGFLIGIVLILLVALLIFYYGLPALRSSAGPTISVPKNINVNITQPQPSK